MPFDITQAVNRVISPLRPTAGSTPQTLSGDTVFSGATKRFLTGGVPSVFSGETPDISMKDAFTQYPSMVKEKIASQFDYSGEDGQEKVFENVMNFSPAGMAARIKSVTQPLRKQTKQIAKVYGEEMQDAAKYIIEKIKGTPFVDSGKADLETVGFVDDIAKKISKKEKLTSEEIRNVLEIGRVNGYVVDVGATIDMSRKVSTQSMSEKALDKSGDAVINPVIKKAEEIQNNTDDIISSIKQAKASGQSFDEWVKGQETLYHSGTADIKAVDLGKTKFSKTFYLSDNADYAKSFGGKSASLNEMVVDSKAKLIDLRKPTEQQISEITQVIQKEAAKPAKYGESFSFYPYSTKDVIQGIKDGKAHFAELPQIKQILKTLGYDGQITAEVPYAKNIGIWNKDVIKTRSQLKAEWDAIQ